MKKRLNITIQQRKIKAAAVVLVALLICVSSSYAWSERTQHKSNLFKTSNASMNLILVESFKPKENWMLGETVEKVIYVKNGQESDNLSEYEYLDGYVRIKVSEIMLQSKFLRNITEFKLLIDSGGNFYCYLNKEDASDFISSQFAFQIEEDIVEYDLENKQECKYYIKYDPLRMEKFEGKYLLLENQWEPYHVLGTNHSLNPTDLNVEANNWLYSNRLWQAGLKIEPIPSDYTKYIVWNLSEDVITLEKWKKDFNMEPVSKWIIDTRIDGDGWIYWGEPLKHDVENSAASTTKPFMNAVTLVNQPDGKIEYRIKVEMDGVSFDDLSSWKQAPNSLINMFRR